MALTLGITQPVSVGTIPFFLYTVRLILLWNKLGSFTAQKPTWRENVVKSDTQPHELGIQPILS